ncbi:DNA-processing protein DprA [Anaeromyxobacter oryzae]|uniref:DNA processing protein DprA n=1 Tax=Anaeromyxobacter oryzae TaxID=2918170 RepID=A0ABM7X2B4_9BACT|nr:DNA-processing protein DprA [Anaeromyxobacter oryzae]BDG05927.1 DNA processing protein DprA [Anaeromyxobacter oryzae]
MESARTIRPDDGLYPAGLARLPDRPAELRVRGALGDVRHVALVGARWTDDYGASLARELAAGLARAGVSIVSGGARGVDAAAHRGALDAGGHTIAVLGTGIDRCYPAEHRSLFEEIVASGGALVSEQPDGTRGWPGNFPARNRIIAALSDAVVVVRAGVRSGALITADRARGIGVPVLAVPGDVRDDLSAGPHALLRSGARPVASAADVLAELGVATPAPVQRPLPTLDGHASALLAALGRKPRHADDLAREAGVRAGAALAGLLTLELEGLCEQRPGHYFLRRNGEGI